VSVLDCFASNPIRPPSWRWERARALFDRDPEAVTARRRTDGPQSYAWIKRALRFLTKLNAPGNANDAVLQVLREWPDIYWAYNIFQNTTTNTRHAIEANILARQSDEQLAKKFGITAATATAYEALFFNVRDRLDNPSYITQGVLLAGMYRGGQNGSVNELYNLWKQYGYNYGPAMVDAMASQFMGVNSWCETPDQVGDAVLDDAIATLKLKAALAAKHVPVNGTTNMQLLDTFIKYAEVERASDSAGQAQNQMLSHVAAMMSTLPFTLNQRPVRGYNPHSSVDDLRKSGVEMTLEEVMTGSTGQPMPRLAALQDLRFPDTSETVTIVQEGTNHAIG